MAKTTFSLHWYDGPATINGVEFPDVHVGEHADSDGTVICKGWEGVATVSKTNAPAINSEWMNTTAQKPSIEVLLPAGGSGQAHVTEAAFVDDDGFRYWRICFAGVGPSPCSEDA